MLNNWLIHFLCLVDILTDWFTDWVIHSRYGGLNDSVILVHCFIDWHGWLLIDPVDWLTDWFTNWFIDSWFGELSHSYIEWLTDLCLMFGWFTDWKKSLIYSGIIDLVN